LKTWHASNTYYCNAYCCWLSWSSSEVQHVFVMTGMTGMTVMLLLSTLCWANFVLVTNVPCYAMKKTFLGKNYGTYSTVFSITFSSFFLKMKSSVSPTNFTDVAFIGSMECETVMFHDGQTHVCCHCIVFVVLSILSMQSILLAMPGAMKKRQMKPWAITSMHMTILAPSIRKGRCIASWMRSGFLGDLDDHSSKWTPEQFSDGDWIWLPWQLIFCPSLLFILWVVVYETIVLCLRIIIFVISTIMHISVIYVII